MSAEYKNSSDISLSVAVAVMAYNNELSFSSYKTLAEWLGCYNYILPEDRVISAQVYELPIKHKHSSILFLYNYVHLLTCGFNLNQQNIIVGYIKCQSLTNQAIALNQKPFKQLTSELTQDLKIFRTHH